MSSSCGSSRWRCRRPPAGDFQLVGGEGHGDEVVGEQEQQHEAGGGHEAPQGEQAETEEEGHLEGLGDLVEGVGEHALVDAPAGLDDGDDVGEAVAGQHEAGGVLGDVGGPGDGEDACGHVEVDVAVSAGAQVLDRREALTEADLAGGGVRPYRVAGPGAVSRCTMRAAGAELRAWRCARRGALPRRWRSVPSQLPGASAGRAAATAPPGPLPGKGRRAQRCGRRRPGATPSGGTGADHLRCGSTRSGLAIRGSATRKTTPRSVARHHRWRVTSPLDLCLSQSPSEP